MYHISLINMPFAALHRPSIALTQLRSVVEKRFGDQVQVRVLYLNHDFVHYLGEDAYEALLSDSNNSGRGEWFFRQVAFGDSADNTAQYFQRYPFAGDSLIKGRILAKRIGLERFLQQLVSAYEIDRDDLVGFTSMFSQNVPSFALARVIKKRNPKAIAVLGGANCEWPMGRELALHIEPIDFVFSGPGLVSFPHFVECLMRGRPDDCHGIQGVLSNLNLADEREGQAKPSVGAELPIGEAIPLDYESFLQNLEKSFSGRLRPALPFETSRGCWWGQRAHCTFCGLNGGSMAYRAMPSESAIEYIEELVERYSQRCAHFESVDNIMPKEYLEEVFPRLTPPKGVSFFYEVKADLSSRDMRILSKAGVTEIQPGIEALASSTLKLMKKGTTAFRNIAFLKNCVRFGIQPAWNLLIGFPGESEEIYKKYLQDLPLLYHLPPPHGVFPVRFDRFSPYHVRAAEYGLDLSPYDFYRFLYPLDEKALSDLAYYFEDRNYSSRYLVEMVAWQRKLEEAIQRWKEHWSQSQGGLPRRLELAVRGGRTLIVDTRDGTHSEEPLEEHSEGILRLLDQRGRKAPDISRQLNLSEQEAGLELDRLLERDLLFEESGRYMSLVLAHPTEAEEGEHPGRVSTQVRAHAS